MVEQVEGLGFQPQLDVFGQSEPFGEIEIAPDKIRATQGVAAEVAELAILRAVAAVALSCARIDGGRKCIWIEPLERARLRDLRDRPVLIERDAGNDAGELRAAALHDASRGTGRVGRRPDACGVGRAQDREWNP